GVEATADAVAGEESVEPCQQLGAGQRLTVQAHRLALAEAEGDAQRLRRPFRPRPAPGAGTLARRFPAVDLGTGQRHAQQVLVDRVLLLPGADAEATLLRSAERRVGKGSNCPA